MSLVTTFLISQDLSTLTYDITTTTGKTFYSGLSLWNPEDPDNVIVITDGVVGESHISGTVNLADNGLGTTELIGSIMETLNGVQTTIHMLDSSYQYDAMTEMIDILDDIFANNNAFHNINTANRERLQILQTLLETIDLSLELNDILQANVMISHLKNVLAS